MHYFDTSVKMIISYFNNNAMLLYLVSFGVMLDKIGFELRSDWLTVRPLFSIKNMLS